MVLVRFTTPDLFADDEAPGAAAEFRAAFDGWLRAEQEANRFRRASTGEVYEDMWGAFMEWSLGQDPPVTLPAMCAQDLQAFLQSRKGTESAGTLSDRYAWRMVALIDKVLMHWAKTNSRPRNEAAGQLIRATPELRQANLQDPPALDYLEADEARRLVTFLSSVRPGAAGHRRLNGWQDLRNITAVALHLGAGLTAGEVRELHLDAASTSGGRLKGVPWKLKVAGNGNRAARETPVAQWAGQLLRFWLEVRTEAALPAASRVGRDGKPEGPFLLPGRSGQQWGKIAHYEAVKAVLEAAQVGSGTGGSFRLRHTFAIRQLRRKKAPADVARWMGIANPEELARYQRVLLDYEDLA